MNNRQRRTNSKKSRRGSLLVVALVCLLVVVSLMGHMLLAAVRNGRQLHTERDHRQCELLLQAGIVRSLRQLAADASYQGEIRDVPADEIIDQAAGRITVKVTQPDGATTTLLHVIAEYPLGTIPSVRRSRQLQVNSRPTQE